MNILSKVTWKAMWKNKILTVVTIIGIILSAAMFMAVTTAAFSALDFVIRGYVYTDGDYFIGFNEVTDAQVKELEENEIVSQIADYKVLGFAGLVENHRSDTGFSEEVCVAAVNKTFLEKMPVHLIEGRLPENSNEILVPERYMELYELKNIPVAVGDTVTHLIQTRLVDEPDPLLYNEYPYEEWKTVYTIVGVVNDQHFAVTNQYLLSILTLDDGKQHDHLYHRVFVRTSPAKAVYDLEKAGFGTDCAVNDGYLRFFAATRYENINAVIYGIIAVLLGIIMIASVSLIHNAFSISVSERTKQFGLLSGVGATRKQIRRSVIFEAGVVCLFGIPFGLIAGYLGIAIVLVNMNHVFQSLFTFGENVDMTAVVSLPAIAIAAVVCILTVCISAWIPSKRATKVTAIDAIRQSADYKATAKQVKTGRLTGKIFGLPGLMSRKYYKISRKKYRSTIVSLTISLILFVVASYFCSLLTASFEHSMGTRNFDIMLTPHSESALKDFEIIRTMPGVSKAVYTDISSHESVIATQDYSEDYLYIAQKRAEAYYGKTVEGKYDLTAVMVHYVEDDAFFSYLKENNLDAAKYQDPDKPSALVLIADYTTPYMTNEQGELVRYVYHCSPVTDSLKQLTLSNVSIPDGLFSDISAAGIDLDTTVNDDGVIIMELQGMYANSEGMIGPSGEKEYFAVVSEENEDGILVSNYYSYNPATKKIGSDILYTDDDAVNRTVLLGDRVEQVPFGVEPSSGDINLIMPLSAYTGSMLDDLGEVPNLALKVEDYAGVIDALKPYDGNGMYIDDYLSGEMNARGLILLIKVLSYGFIILISLISIANVFNTISTNIMLRKRDFGILRSVGMRNRDLHRMMAYECLLYGSRALLWGIPISILLSYGCYRIANAAYVSAFQIPVIELLLAASIIFFVVAITMAYAVSKLRKDNPIDAIRMENT